MVEISLEECEHIEHVSNEFKRRIKEAIEGPEEKVNVGLLYYIPRHLSVQHKGMKFHNVVDRRMERIEPYLKIILRHLHFPAHEGYTSQVWINNYLELDVKENPSSDLDELLKTHSRFLRNILCNSDEFLLSEGKKKFKVYVGDDIREILLDEIKEYLNRPDDNSGESTINIPTLVSTIERHLNLFPRKGERLMAQSLRWMGQFLAEVYFFPATDEKAEKFQEAITTLAPTIYKAREFDFMKAILNSKPKGIHETNLPLLIFDNIDKVFNIVFAFVATDGSIIATKQIEQDTEQDYCLKTKNERRLNYNSFVPIGYFKHKFFFEDVKNFDLYKEIKNPPEFLRPRSRLLWWHSFNNKRFLFAFYFSEKDVSKYETEYATTISRMLEFAKLHFKGIRLAVEQEKDKTETTILRNMLEKAYIPFGQSLSKIFDALLSSFHSLHDFISSCETKEEVFGNTMVQDSIVAVGRFWENSRERLPEEIVSIFDEHISNLKVHLTDLNRSYDSLIELYTLYLYMRYPFIMLLDWCADHNEWSIEGDWPEFNGNLRECLKNLFKEENGKALEAIREYISDRVKKEHLQDFDAKQNKVYVLGPGFFEKILEAIEKNRKRDEYCRIALFSNNDYLEIVIFYVNEGREIPEPNRKALLSAVNSVKDIEWRLPNLNGLRVKLMCLNGKVYIWYKENTTWQPLHALDSEIWKRFNNNTYRPQPDAYLCFIFRFFPQ